MKITQITKEDLESIKTNLLEQNLSKKQICEKIIVALKQLFRENIIDYRNYIIENKISIKFNDVIFGCPDGDNNWFVGENHDKIFNEKYHENSSLANYLIDLNSIINQLNVEINCTISTNELFLDGVINRMIRCVD